MLRNIETQYVKFEIISKLPPHNAIIEPGAKKIDINTIYRNQPYQLKHSNDCFFLVSIVLLYV